MGDLLFDSISVGKWCPLGHTSPTVKHTPATESKVHNGEGPYLHPDLRFSRSLHHGKPGWDMRARSITVRALTLTLTFASPAFSEGPYLQKTALFRHPNLSTKICVTY